MRRAHHLLDFVRSFDRMTVDADDHVALPESRTFRRAAFGDAIDQHATAPIIQTVAQLIVERLKRHPQPAVTRRLVVRSRGARRRSGDHRAEECAEREDPQSGTVKMRNHGHSPYASFKAKTSVPRVFSNPRRSGAVPAIPLPSGSTPRAMNEGQ